MVAPEDFARAAGLSFSDRGWLRQALTHRSYVNEHPDEGLDNERLEYLGDGALDFLAAAWLYEQFPDMDEGGLTRLRAALVRTEQLAEFAQEIHLGDALRLGRGEEVSGGRERPALLCGAFEALLGALYLDAGLPAVREFLDPRLKRATEEIVRTEAMFDARSVLQMWSQARLGETPRYRTVETHGPDHAREFVVEVAVGERLQGRGQGRSKQEAAQHAAADALMRAGHSAPPTEP